MIEQLYTDFTTKLLPTIQEGLVITKDYFIEFFGRYIKYLIIKDSIYLGLLIICLVIVSKVLKNSIARARINKDSGGGEVVLIMFSICILIITLATSIITANNLIKDIYVPELRIYEEFRDYKNVHSI